MFWSVLYVGVMEEERRGTFKRAESFGIKIGKPTDSTLPFSDLGLSINAYVHNAMYNIDLVQLSDY